MRIEFVAFAGDCIVRGDHELPDAGRLTDVLNGADDLVIRNAVLTGHGDGRVVELDELILGRDDVYAVVAPDAGGDGVRRIHTVRHRIDLQAGPYRIVGHLHTLPGAQPLTALRRQPFVPLTHASSPSRTRGASPSGTPRR
jgi:hypothetical protein